MPKPFPYKNSPGDPFFGAPSRLPFSSSRRCRRQLEMKPLELNLQVKKHHRDPLVLPHPSPWREVHRSEPPPAPSLEKKGATASPSHRLPDPVKLPVRIPDAATLF
jgi:hypothetical protein